VRGSRLRRGLLFWLGVALLGAASLRLVVWESYPDLFGNAMAPVWLRAVAFAVTIGGWYAAARGFGRDQRPHWLLLAAAHLLTVWWIMFAITAAFVNNHAIPSAHEGLLVAAAWSLYGFGLALAERRRPHAYLRMAALALVSAGLIFLMAGALMSNLRWGLPGYRLFAYAAVLGSAWAVEGLFARSDDQLGLHGLVSLTAMVSGFIIAGFEVARWLEPVFTFAPDAFRSQASWDWEAAIRASWNMIAWGAYSLACMAGAVVARSPRGRALAGLLAGATLVAGIYGAFQVAAPLSLRLPAVAAAAGGAALSAWLAGRAGGPQLRSEPRMRRALWLGSAALLLVWGAANIRI
jgi:hypothetical protein